MDRHRIRRRFYQVSDRSCRVKNEYLSNRVVIHRIFEAESLILRGLIQDECVAEYLR